MNYEALFKELTRQVEHRRLQATDLYFDLNSSDPALYIPLTEYQKGLMNGRVAALEYVCILISELKAKADEFETVKETN